MKKYLFLMFLALGLSLQAHAAHTVTLNASNNTCNNTTAQNCTMQLYRAAGNCPASGIGSLSYTLVAPAVVASTSTSTSQSFSYVDSSVADGQTYCYYATNSYSAGGGPSAPSVTFQGVIPFSTPAAPSFSGVVN